MDFLVLFKEEIVAVVQFTPQERAHERNVEQSVNVPVPLARRKSC